MPVDSATVRYQFPTTLGRFFARFDAGRATSDGGLVWLAEAERAVAVCAALAEALPEWCHRLGSHAAQLLPIPVIPVGRRARSAGLPSGQVRGSASSARG